MIALRILGFVLLGSSLLMSGCATTPAAIDGEFADVDYQRATQGTTSMQSVRWGGEIISVDPAQDETCFEVLGQPLARDARPIDDSQAYGRFVACREGFYDPMIFEAGRELTVVGRLDGTMSGKVGDYDYTYPRINADTVYLWPPRQELDTRVSFGTSFGFGYHPYWHDPFFHPRVYVVRPPRHDREPKE